MGNAQWLLELALLLLLGATLFHAVRLERALGVLKRDRAILEELVEGFNQSTRQAETAIERLRTASDGAGRQMARQTDTAQRLREDLQFLADRGERLAERLESAVRGARMLGDGFALSAPASAPTSALAPALSAAAQAASAVRAAPPAPAQLAPAFPPAPSSGLQAALAPAQAELPQPAPSPPRLDPAAPLRRTDPAPEAAGQLVLRSQAERELLRALRAGR